MWVLWIKALRKFYMKMRETSGYFQETDKHTFLLYLLDISKGGNFWKISTNVCLNLLYVVISEKLFQLNFKQYTLVQINKVCLFDYSCFKALMELSLPSSHRRPNRTFLNLCFTDWLILQINQRVTLGRNHIEN